MAGTAIRTAKPEDAPALADLSAQLGYPTSVEQSAQRLRIIIDSRDHAVLVAGLADGSVAGWVHVYVALRVESRAFAELGGMVVAEGRRDHGIGTDLLAAAEAWAVERGITRLRVRSRTGRAAAHAFYARRGFSLTKEQQVYDKNLEARPA